MPSYRDLASYVKSVTPDLQSEDDRLVAEYAVESFPDQFNRTEFDWNDEPTATISSTPHVEFPRNAAYPGRAVGGAPTEEFPATPITPLPEEELATAGISDKKPLPVIGGVVEGVKRIPQAVAAGAHEALAGGQRYVAGQMEKAAKGYTMATGFPEESAKLLETAKGVKQTATTHGQAAEILDPTWYRSEKIQAKLEKIKEHDPNLANSFQMGDISGATQMLVFDAYMRGDQTAKNQAIQLSNEVGKVGAKRSEAAKDKKGVLGTAENVLNATSEMIPMMGKGLALNAVPVAGPILATSMWAKQGAGEIITALKDRGVDDDTSLAYGILGGIPYALVERLQVGQVANIGAKKIIGDSVKKKLLQVVKTKGVDYLKENAEEVAQSLIEEKAINEAVKSTGVQVDPKLLRQRYLNIVGETLKQTVGPMGVLTALGLGAGSGRVAIQRKGTTEQPAAVQQPIGELERGLPPTTAIQSPERTQPPITIPPGGPSGIVFPKLTLDEYNALPLGPGKTAAFNRLSDLDQDRAVMQYKEGVPSEGSAKTGETGGQAEIGGKQTQGIPVRDAGRARTPEAAAEASIQVIEPLDENRIVGMVERLKAAGTAQEKQAIVEGITGEEAKEVLRRAQGIPKAEVSKLSKEEVKEVSAYAKEGRPLGGRQYEGGALPEVERKQRGIILNKNEELDKLGPELEKQIDGIKYGGAQWGIARPGKVVQPTMTFRDEFTGSNVNVTKEGGLEELKRRIQEVRQANPEAVSKSIATQVGGLTYVGKKQRIGQVTGAGRYNTEDTYQYKTDDGTEVTINPGDTVEKIKSYLESKKGAVNEKAGQKTEALLKQTEPPTVTAPVQKEPTIKGSEDLKRPEVELPKQKPFPKLQTRVSDIILNRYIKKGATEGKTAQELHNNVIQLLDKALPIDIAEASGITEDEAKTAVADIKAGKTTDAAMKVRTALAPRLLYNQTVDEVYNEITEPRDASGKIMFSKKEEADDLDIELALKKRNVRGDDLLDQIDKAQEIRDGKGLVDKNGYVVLYHRTDKRSADKIVKSGQMTSKEDGLFFSTRPTGQAEGYGDTVVKVRLPIEKLEVNDIFVEETHLRYPTRSIGKMIPVGKAEVVTEEQPMFSKKEHPNTRKSTEPYTPSPEEEQLTKAVYRDKTPTPGVIRIVEPNAEQQALKDAFEEEYPGKEVVWIDINEKQLMRDIRESYNGFMFRGAIDPALKNKIFVNVNTDKPAIQIAYHELTHFIQQNPELNAAFWDAAKLTTKGKELVAKRGRDEVMADIAGEMMADPEFQKALHDQNKSAFKAIFDKLMEILDRITKALTGRKNAKRYTQYVEDVEGLRDTLKGILREYGGEQATGEQRMAASRRFKWGPEAEKEIDALDKRMYDIQQGVFKRMKVAYNEDWMDNLTPEESDEWRELSYKIKKLQGMPISYILKNEAQQIMEAGQRRLGGDDLLTSWRTKLSQKEKDRLDEIQRELSATTVDYDDPEVPDQLKQRFQEDLYKSVQKQPGFKKWVEIPEHLKVGIDAITRTIQAQYDENEIENITSGEKRIESNEIEELNTPKTALVYSPEFADEILPMKYRFGIGSWFVVGKKVGSKDTPYVVRYKRPLDLSYKMSIDVVEKLVDDLPKGSDWAKFKGKRDRLEGVFNAYYDALVNPKQPNEIEIEARSSSIEETEAMMSRESQIRQQAYNPNIMFLASIGEEIGDGNVVESLKEMGIDSILMNGKNYDYIMPIEDIFGNYNVANLYGDWKKEAPIVKERDVLHGDTREKVTIKGEPDWNNIKTKIQYDEPVQKEKIYLYGDKFTAEDPEYTGGWKYSYSVDNATEAASWVEKNKNNSYWRNFLDTKETRDLFDSYNGEIDKKVLDELAIIKEKEAIPKTVIEFYYDGHYHKTTVPGKVDDAEAKEAVKKEWIDRHGNKDREEYQYQKRRDKYEGKKNAREVDKKIIDAVGGYIDNPDIRYSKKSGEGQPMFSKKVTETDLPELYEEAKGFNKKKSAKEIRKIYANKRNAGETARWLLRTTTGRLMDISPVIRDQVQKHVSGITLDTAKATRKILPLLNALKKMPSVDYRVFDLAAKQADTEKINELAKRYDFEDALKAYRDTFNGLIKRLLAAGYETGYLKDYFPRMSKDRDAYRNFIRGTPEWGSIDEAIREKQKKIGRQMTDEEQEEFLDLYIRGYGDKMNAAKPGNLKERKVKFISNEMNSLLEDTMVAIPLYVERMIKKAARKEFFDPQQKDTELEINNIDDSIGEYVSQQIKDKKLDPRKQDELIGVLKSFFNYKPTKKSFAAIKNLGYMTTMGSGFSSMFSQMADAAFGFYTTGTGEVPAVAKALFGKTGLTVKDLGVDNVAGEFRDPGKISAAVDKLFKAVGIKWGDSIFKNAFLEANLRKYQRMAKSGKLNKDFEKDLKNIFGDQADSVVEDLADEVDSDNVKLLMLNQMSKFQPVTLLQVPQAYLDMPRGRIAYALKTYQINQLNAILDEAKRGMATATTQKDFKEAAMRVATLAAFLVACGIGTDAFKDYLFRRKANFGEYLTDNMLKLALISRYTTWKIRTDGWINTALNLVSPQISWLDYAWKDITKIQKAATTPGPNNFAWKDLQSIRVLPVIGQELYWWYGGGKESVQRREKYNAVTYKNERKIAEHKKLIKWLNEIGDTTQAKIEIEKFKPELDKIRRQDSTYYAEELKKEYPKYFATIYDLQISKSKVDNARARIRLKKLTPGQERLYSKYRQEQAAPAAK